MPNRLCVIDLPGLGHPLLQHIPGDTALGRWIAGQRITGLTPCFPALTCSMHATLTTGADPQRHGIIANGLPTLRSVEDQALVDASNFASYRREVSFWEQSNQFVQANRFWQDSAGKSRCKTAFLFFQNCMPGFSGMLRPAADIVITPKPDHGPDGKLTSLCWSSPAELVRQISAELGAFPLMNYWGPMASIPASQWIAAAAAWVWRNHQPDIQLTYIPHLDYDLQRFGPDSPQAALAVASAARAVEPILLAALGSGARVVVLSDYAIRPVSHAVFPNRLLRQADLLVARQTPDGPLVDYDRSAAFAMVDHQIAHIYIRDRARLAEVREVFAKAPHVAHVLDASDLAGRHSHHSRSGDLVLEAADDAWFAYPWWTEEADAPAFAGMVDIHRKPGYDPLELFWDRQRSRISDDPALVRGSHGLVKPGEAVLIGDAEAIPESTVAAHDVAGILGRIAGL